MTKKADFEDVFGSKPKSRREPTYWEGYRAGFELGYEKKGAEVEALERERELLERRQAVSQWN